MLAIKSMARAAIRPAGWLAGWMLCAPALGQDDVASPAGPYQGIVVRNVFDLKPPAPATPIGPIETAMPKCCLSGIATIPSKRAFITLTDRVKPGEPAKAKSYAMSEGQREGELEILRIDEVARAVRVSYAGTIMVLDFTNTAAKPAPGELVPPSTGAAMGTRGVTPGGFRVH